VLKLEVEAAIVKSGVAGGGGGGGVAIFPIALEAFILPYPYEVSKLGEPKSTAVF
jgi:hypothetical protein